LNKQTKQQKGDKIN